MAKIALFWGKFGPYHHDRCRALATAMGSTGSVLGIEMSDRSPIYAWDSQSDDDGFQKQTLFPGRGYEELSRTARFSSLVRACIASKSRHVFLCHYEQPEYFLVAIVLRGLGRRVYVMQDSKFDDRMRSFWKEFVKRILYWPYHGALVASSRTRAYLRFLGFREAQLASGYDTVSVKRVQALARTDSRSASIEFMRRHFTVVARFVPKKNIALAIQAYALYRERTRSSVRDLVIVGSGPLLSEFERMAAEVPGVQFTGFLQAAGVARVLAHSLALVLPSIEEQWGLVVNEALAVGVPVLVSDAVGARDILVRTAVNGYIFEPDNAEGLSRLMQHIAEDSVEWTRLSIGASTSADGGDVTSFVEGVMQLTQIRGSVPVEGVE